MFRLTRIFCHGTTLNNCLKNTSRSLYSQSSLGIDGFLNKREKVKHYFSNNADKFREKMTDFVENNDTGMIFTEDLKNMIHLADPTERDVELLEKMLLKFSKPSKETRFGNFVFGPIVMRFFHHIKDADRALKLFKDPQMDGFFDQLMTYQILTDMLYEQGRYQDVIDVYKIIKSRQVQGGMHPRHVILLVFASCYKENTPETFKFSSELWSELQSSGHIPMRRTITFAAALALKQNAPAIALEIAGTARQQQYVTVRNIKVLAYTALGRADDALPILKSVIQGNESTQQSFTKDAIDNLRTAVNESGDNELVTNFNRLEKFLSENGQLSEITVDDLLTTEINSSTSQNFNSRDRNVIAASYNNQRNDNNYKNNNNKRRAGIQRAGLEDLH